MRYKTEDIRRQVRVLMDENDQSGMLDGYGDDIDTLTLDEIIDNVLPDVLREVLEASPPEQLGEGLPIDPHIFWETAPGIGMGRVMVPPDYLRLVTFQLSDWDYALHEHISADSALYKAQRRRWGAIKGRPEHPIVALVPQPAGLTLEFYSCDGGPGVYLKRGRYLPIPRIDKGMIEIPVRLLRDTVHATAVSVLGILNPASKTTD